VSAVVFPLGQSVGMPSLVARRDRIGFTVQALGSL